MIELKDVYKTFGKKDARVRALSGINLFVAEGEMVAIMGKSGSGKSTLLNILGGMMSMDNGEYLYNGKPVNFESQRELTRFRRDEVGFVVQYFALVEDLNVFQNVALPLRYQGMPRARIKEMVREALAELGIEQKAKAYPSELSGGQQQRVAIARAVVKNPHVLLADEPTGALDEATGNEVMSIFEELHDKGKTIIIVTHDNSIAKRCGRIVYVRDGVVQNADSAMPENGVVQNDNSAMPENEGGNL